MNKNNLIRGLSVCHPVEADRDYLLYAVDCAINMGFNHIQICGPIHDAVRGNIDGMTKYQKYACFNREKDMAYVERAMDTINAACNVASAAGIRTYMWHHELELPASFKEIFPETLNGCGDIEVTHPRIKDFLIHKIRDFFCAYPMLDGIVLTLHETKIPLLKLKDQKLDKVQRVKYVTQIIFDTCKALGKELIVRPFASIEEDYVLMAKAYEEISPELTVMDKWTQFDWSLTMPHNRFFQKITGNPLMVEADIFGEFFGKGWLPLMLKDHISEKLRYCNDFHPTGYVARIDRGGMSFLGDVNEVNLRIYHAWLTGNDPEKTVENFFSEKYPRCAKQVQALMEQVEDVLKKVIYAQGYYFSELSFFPSVNHSKNHFYFEMMRSQCCISSNEWFIPTDWKPVPAQSFLTEKKEALRASEELLAELERLEPLLEPNEYRVLWEKFCNLKLAASAWYLLVKAFFHYVRYFESYEESYRTDLENDLDQLLALDRLGEQLLGEHFFCRLGVSNRLEENGIVSFVRDLRSSFQAEKALFDDVMPDWLDFIPCGGAMEGHNLQKEVNFSDTLLENGTLCRIPGNRRGMEWSSITAHGWFSYTLRVQPLCENIVTVRMAGTEGKLDVAVTLGDECHIVSEKFSGMRDFTFEFRETEGKNTVRIRFDKRTAAMPRILQVRVCN